MNKTSCGIQTDYTSQLATFIKAKIKTVHLTLIWKWSAVESHYFMSPNATQYPTLIHRLQSNPTGCKQATHLLLHYARITVEHKTIYAPNWGWGTECVQEESTAKHDTFIPDYVLFFKKR
jgi:hypothetical protein